MLRFAALALTMLAVLALAPNAAPAPAVKRALVTWEVTGERFRTYLLRREDVARVRQAIRLGESAGIPIGRIYRGTQVNIGHRWHLRNVRLADATIELCDGRPSDLDSDLNYWVDTVERYCPWGAKPVRLRWVTPSAPRASRPIAS